MPTSVPVLRTGEFLFKTTSNITECSLVSFKKIVGYVPSGDLGGRHWRDGFWSKKVSENPQNTINNIRNFRALNGFFGNLVRQNLFFVPPPKLGNKSSPMVPACMLPAIPNPVYR